MRDGPPSLDANTGGFSVGQGVTLYSSVTGYAGIFAFAAAAPFPLVPAAGLPLLFPPRARARGHGTDSCNL